MQIIVEEGQVIPADARLICDYEHPEAFAEYQEMHVEDEDDPTEKPEVQDEDADEDEKHHGMTILAADQSAITGESLAVDKYMVRADAGHMRRDRVLTRHPVGRCSVLHGTLGGTALSA